MTLEELLNDMESGKYDNLKVSELGRIVRESEENAQLLMDEIAEDARLTAEDIKYEIESQRAGEIL